MAKRLRVLIEQPPKGKRWVAIAGDWPGLERNGKTEEEAVAKLDSYRPRYLKIAQRAGFGTDFEQETKPTVVDHHIGTGSTDFWGISFAPSDEDRKKISDATFEKRIALLRAAWAEFDEVGARVSAELQQGPRGGGREREKIIRHVLRTEGEDFAKRVKVPTSFDDDARRTPGDRAAHRDRFVRGMRDWRAEGKPLGNWTVLYLLRHSAYHVLDHTWEMEDRDLTPPAE